MEKEDFEISKSQLDALGNLNISLRTEYERRVRLVEYIIDQHLSVDRQLEEMTRTSSRFMGFVLAYIAAALIFSTITVFMFSTEELKVHNSTLLVLMLFALPIFNSLANAHQFNTRGTILSIERMRCAQDWNINTGLDYDELAKCVTLVRDAKEDEEIKWLLDRQKYAIKKHIYKQLVGDNET